MFVDKYFLGVLPGFLICLLFIELDKNRNKNIIKYILLFLFGSFSCYIDHRVENIVGSFFPEMVDMNFVMVFIYAVFGVAIFEEGAKWFFTLLFGYRSIGKKEILSFAVICSMGFATFENFIYYIVNGSFVTAIVRMVTAVPSHACDAIIMGYFLIKAGKYIDKKRFYIILGLIVPVLVHAIYNALIYKGIMIFEYINIIFYFTIVVICIKIVVQNVRSGEND